jgi:uncharacterized membrane protein
MRVLEQTAKQFRIKDWNIDKKYVSCRVFSAGLFLMILFPLFVISLIITPLIFAIPKAITAKIKDRRLYSSVQVVVTALVSLPLSCLLVFALAWWLTGTWIAALACALCIPPAGVFVVNYHKACGRWSSLWRYWWLRKKHKTDEYVTLRKKAFESLDKILKES